MRYRIPKATIPELAAIREQQIGRIMGNLRQLDKETVYEVTIGKAKDKRTNDQNRKFHAMCRELADFVGYNEEEMKVKVKHALGYYETVKNPVYNPDDPDSYPCIFVYPSSATYEPEKMSRAIEQLNLWAIDVGYVWRVE